MTAFVVLSAVLFGLFCALLTIADLLPGQRGTARLNRRGRVTPAAGRPRIERRA